MTTKLSAGDWVKVRSAKEILATLDATGCKDGMPFMPEMLDFVGRRVRVATRAHKTCDTVNKTGGRQLEDAVHLDDSRCSGAAHGGCDAMCLLFWKVAWLEPVEVKTDAIDSPQVSNGSDDPFMEELTKIVHASSLLSDDAVNNEVYRCQATDLYKATTSLAWWDPRHYYEDLSSGNVSFRRMISTVFFHGLHKLMGIGIGYRLWRWIYDSLQPRVGGFRYPFAAGRIPPGQPTPASILDLQSGEKVRIKSFKEILETLDKAKMNRGMRFDPEMVPYCEKTFTVRRRVTRIVDEQTGRLIEMKTPCVILGGVVCKSAFSNTRLFCPRALPSYWREIWLDRENDGEPVVNEPLTRSK